MFWPLVILAGVLLLPGSPLILHTRAGVPGSSDAAGLEQKLAELERACRQADLTPDETQAAIAVAKRVKGDKREVVKLHATGKLNAVEQRAYEKLIRTHGHPLERDLAKLREVAAEAKLTAEETAAAEKLAQREGFDNDAILLQYESGKLSAVEKSAVEKVLAAKGHPHAQEIAKLTEAARQVGLTDEQIKTLRGLATRAGWDLDKIKEWKRSQQLSEAEAAAVAKLEPMLAGRRTENAVGGSEKARAFRRLARVLELSDEETDDLLAAAKQAGADERGLLEAQRAGQLSGPAAAGLKKLEGLLGKLADFVDSPHKAEIGRLLEHSATAGLTLEETRAILKVAVSAKFDLDAVKQLQAAGRLSEVEARAFAKLLTSIGR